MSTLAEWVESATAKEPIEAAVIGLHGHWTREPGPVLATCYAAQEPIRFDVIPWSVARPLLNYDPDQGQDEADCNALWVWTASRVIFVSRYDGSMSIQWVPRHPTPGTPTMIAGDMEA